MQQVDDPTDDSRSVSEFSEPAFVDSDSDNELANKTEDSEKGPSEQQNEGTHFDEHPDGFIDFLKKHADPTLQFSDQQEKLAQYPEFNIVSPKNRLKLFDQWASTQHSFLDIVQKYWEGSLYYPQFKQKYKSLPGFNSKYSEKQRMSIYRDFTRFKKKSPSERAQLRELLIKDSPEDLRLAVLDLIK